MRYILLFLIILSFSSKAQTNVQILSQKIPVGDAQLKSDPVWFTTGEKSDGLEIKYCGQKETNGKIRLTASNGYFSSGIRAKGESKYPFLTTNFIAKNYEYLDGWNNNQQTLRWHLYCKKPGRVIFNIELEPFTSGSLIKVSLNGQATSFQTEKGISSYPLSLELKKSGKSSVILSAEKVTGSKVGRLYGVDIFGNAIVGSQLLRARWRPGAVHSYFRSSKTKTPKVWVMSSKSMTKTKSYSPIMTPFGYFGTGFDEERKVKKGMNFSMWSKLDVPLEQITHLIAVGSLKADFGGFGHEGTGVKLRGDWEPLAHKPTILTQALRVEYDDNYATYYGYFLDEKGDWKFYCAGKKWRKRKSGREALWPGAFVEVTGPPQQQRSGDLLREVHRQGWSMDSERNWFRLDLMSHKDTANKNKNWGVSSDGWFVMRMGGMEHFDYPSSNKLKVNKLTELPEFLKSEKANQLFQTPVTFGEVQLNRIGNSKASLVFDLKETGANPSGIIYYGEKNYLTFAPRKLHGTEKKSSIIKESGTWPNSISLKSLTKGQNKVEIKNLKHGIKYWFRILIINDKGRQWSHKSFSL